MMRKKYSVIIMMIALFGGQTALAQEKIVPETPPVPQDRLDTLYYNKSWKVTPNKAFANYYRLALYPADSTAAKEFRTYYMSGELQGEGSFVVLDRKDDAKSQFAGTFTTYFKDGQVEQKKTYHLNHPWEGLFVDVNIWRTLDDFSSGSLCLVLASKKFKEEDYIREYDEYLKYVRHHI